MNKKKVLRLYHEEGLAWVALLDVADSSKSSVAYIARLGSWRFPWRAE
jgi:hypothetical protein